MRGKEKGKKREVGRTKKKVTEFFAENVTLASFIHLLFYGPIKSILIGFA